MYEGRRPSEEAAMRSFHFESPARSNKRTGPEDKPWPMIPSLPRDSEASSRPRQSPRTRNTTQKRPSRSRSRSRFHRSFELRHTSDIETRLLEFQFGVWTNRSRDRSGPTKKPLQKLKNSPPIRHPPSVTVTSKQSTERHRTNEKLKDRGRSQLPELY